MNDKLPAWTIQAKGLLDESADHLDASALSRLNRARQHALEQRRPRVLRAWFVPAGFASACALLLAVAVAWQMPRQHSGGDLQLPVAMQNSGMTASDLDIVSGDDGLEFYQDLEFYAWLDAQNQDGDG
jgi:hypothetical protein